MIIKKCKSGPCYNVSVTKIGYQSWIKPLNSIQQHFWKFAHICRSLISVDQNKTIPP